MINDQIRFYLENAKQIFEWKDKIEKDELLIREIIDIDSTYMDIEDSSNLNKKTKDTEKDQKNNSDSGESQFQMLKKLELSVEEQKKVFQHCSSRGIQFLSTPFDNKSLRFLSEELGLETLKIPSGELVNGPFLLDFARTNKNIILSM